jgi:hypothetical protein
MEQTAEEAAKEYANENCWIPEELHDSEIPDYMEHFAKYFVAGSEWQAKQAIEILSSVLDNWVHGGDADCIIAEFEEELMKK